MFSSYVWLILHFVCIRYDWKTWWMIKFLKMSTRHTIINFPENAPSCFEHPYHIGLATFYSSSKFFYSVLSCIVLVDCRSWINSKCVPFKVILILGGARNWTMPNLVSTVYEDTLQCLCESIFLLDVTGHQNSLYYFIIHHKDTHEKEL